MSETASDPDLLQLYAAGDPGAGRVLVERHAPRILGLARRTLGDRAEAEDVAQEVMLKMWRIAPDWEADRAKLSTWLYRVTLNACTDRQRKHRPTHLDEIAEPVDEAPSQDARLIAQDRAKRLDAALLQLPDRQRQAVILRHIEGMANPEIADILEISTEAVESLTARGKRTLAGLLASAKEEIGYETG